MKQDPPGYDFLSDLGNQVFSLSQLVEGGMSLEQIRQKFSEEEIQALVDSDEPESAELRQYLQLQDRQEPESSTSSPSEKKPPGPSSPTTTSSPTTSSPT